MKENQLIEDFNTFTKAKKTEALRSKLILIFALCVFIGALIFAFFVMVHRDIVVLERTGESLKYVKVSPENSAKLFETLIKSTCADLVYYANSFDRGNLNENRARAKFYCNTQDLERIFTFYNQEKGYYEALELGARYTCELEKFESIRGQDEPYSVAFTSILSIVNGTEIKKIRIHSQGTIIQTSANFPENRTGFFFNSYQQTMSIIRQDE